MLIGFSLAVFVATVLLVRVAIAVLTRKGILDIPNERVQMSQHQEVPVPRGGGLAVMPIIFLSWVICLVCGIYTWPTVTTFASVILYGALLCALTWFDDHRPQGLSVRTRLLIQLVAVSVPLFFWPAEMGRLFPDFVPLIVERIMMAIAWLWFVNLYNFMDGINGISGMQALSIAGGLLIFTNYRDLAMVEGYRTLLVVIMAAAAGYLVWNGRTAARIFLGDVGSIGFGYCLAWLLFVFAAQGSMVPAILIALVYCMDTSITLLKRFFQGKKIWQAHREHYYHRATVKDGLSHLQCVAIIFCTNVILIALGVALLRNFLSPVAGLTIGILLVTALLTLFYVIGRKSGHVSAPSPRKNKQQQ